MQSRFIISLLLLSTFFVGTCFARPLQYQSMVTMLNDAEFEHETQASTGQTTGSWLVYFYETGERIVIQGTQPQDDYWASHNVVVAVMNSKLTRETVERFKLDGKVPALIYIHRGKYYEFEGDKTWERVVQMVENPDEMFVAREVPPPLSEFGRWLKKMQGPAGLPLLVGSFFVVFVFVLYQIFVKPHQVHQRKRKTN
jgi:hypothetical protein